MAPAPDEHPEPLDDSDGWSSGTQRRIGAVIAGTYRLTRLIGSGGSSHVFEAEHLRLGRAFAVKLLRPELDPTRKTAQRFRREARAIARLHTEFIVNVIDCGELEDQTPYLVMELLVGEDLRSLLKREGGLPARRAIPIIIEACRALAVAHGAGLVHRDLKPENLFITRRTTGEDWCKVLDFGVAKMDASLTTNQGAIIGTVRYMSPEQLADGAKVDAATDIHALGAILYECLSGRPAHGGESIQEAMFSILNRVPSELADAPPKLAALVQRCLAKDPKQRPGSARELAEELQASISSASLTASDQTLAEDALAPPVRSQPRVPHQSPLALSAALAFGVVVGALASWRVLAPPAGEPRAKAAAQVSVSSEPKAAVVVTAQPVAFPPPAQPSAAAPASIGSGNNSLSSAKQRSPALGRLARPALAPASQAAPQVSPRVGAVGNLDPANPYSE